MNNTIKQTHSKEAFLHAISRLLERAAYYGLRSLLVLYMVAGVLKMEDVEAAAIYSWFMSGVIFSQILGALLGDLVIGNKKALLIGSLVQGLGAFMLCIPSTTGLYAGLFLIVLGGGLYTPNILSNFGKLYLNKITLLDAGFNLFYFAVNVGAFIGTAAIGYFGSVYGWNISFVSAGVLMLLSTIPILFSKNTETETSPESKSSIVQRTATVLIAIILVAIFWALYELGNIRIYDLQFQLSEISKLNLPKYIWSILNSAFVIPIGLLAIILWTYFYSRQFFKIMLGFIFGAISFGILFFIPEFPDAQHIVWYLIAMCCLGVSEVYIAPIIHSILTQYTNPKYLAIVMSLAFVPTRVFSFLVGLFNEGLYEKPAIAITIALGIMVILSIGLILFHLLAKRQ